MSTGSLSLAACTALALVNGASAGPNAPTASAWSLAPADAPPLAVAVDLTTLARIDVGDLLSAPFPGRTVALEVTGRVDLGPGRFTLDGRVAGDATGWFIVAVHGEGFAAAGRAGGLFRVRGAADGWRHLELVNVEAMEWCSLDDAAAARALPITTTVDRPTDGGCDDGSSIDVLVVYAADARIAAGGTDNLLAELDLMIANSNEAYDNSGVLTALHLVHARELDAPESHLDLDTLTNPRDGIIDGVHDLRDAYAADQVVAVKSGGGGVANGMWTLEPDMATLAFCVSGRTSLPFIMTHEVGHNLGCCHALEDGGGCPPGGGLLFPYSNGHRFTGLSGTLWRTVMAYAPGAWSPLISNPDILFDGKPTGIPGETGSGADNARTINISAPVVATWRCRNDACELLDLPPDAADCDGDEVPDLCAIALGIGTDLNDDGILDACQCLTDPDGSGATDFVDLLLVLAGWGPCEGVCPGDVDFDGTVGFTDVLAVLAAWGPC